MKNTTIKELFDLSNTVAIQLFSNLTYPWEALSKIKEFIVEIGKTLPREEYYSPNDGIWISKSASVAPSAFISAPCIIESNSEIRHCAFIRGGVIIGNSAVVGNSCEIKNAILFDRAQAPHFNYVGDSILGYKAHLGAGVITSNLKSDKTLVTVSLGEEKIETGLKKIGAIIGDFAEVGCNSVLNPGTVIGRNSTVYPLSSVRGYIPPDSIFKSPDKIIKKQSDRSNL